MGRCGTLSTESSKGRLVIAKVKRVLTEEER